MPAPSTKDLMLAVKGGAGTAAPVTPSNLTFANSLAISGAGFQNTLARSSNPGDYDIVLSGSDVGGILRSTTGGRGSDAWRRVDCFWTGQMQKVAAIAFFPDDPTRVIAGSGVPGSSDRGEGGGIFSSTDKGATWTANFTGSYTSGPQFSGGSNTGVGSGGIYLPGNDNNGGNFEHPRSTGRLFAFDTTRSLVYAGSFSSGLWRASYSSLGSWTKVFNETDTSQEVAGSYLYIRCIVADPSDPTRIYVGTYGNGLWRVDGANGGAPTITRFTSGGAPTIVEDLIFHPTQNVLYLAAGPDGVYRVNTPDATPSFTQEVSGITFLNGAGGQSSNSRWQSLAIRSVDSTTAVLYAGCCKPAGTGTTRQALMQNTASGASGTLGSWSNAWGSGGTVTLVSWNIGGSTGPTWFLPLSPNAQTSVLPNGVNNGDGSSFVSAFIDLRADDPSNKILIAGRSGIWGTEDGFATSYPYVSRMGVTNLRGVEPGASAGQALCAITDWVCFSTTDDFTNVTKIPPSQNTGYGINYSPDDSRYYLCAGNRDFNTQGKIWSRTFAGAWQDENLYTGSGGIVDTFNRNETNGWGTADQGGIYTVTSPKAFYGVTNLSSPNRGYITFDVSSTSYTAYLANTSDDSSGEVVLAFDAHSAGTTHFAGVQLRHDGSSGGTQTFYEIRLEETAGTPTKFQLHFRKVIGGTADGSLDTVVVLSTPSAYAPSTYWNITWNIVGTGASVEIQAKTWLVSEVEPDGWMIDVTDSAADRITAAGLTRIRAGYNSGGYSALGTNVLIDYWDSSGSGSSISGKRPMRCLAFKNASNQIVRVAAVDSSGVYTKTDGDSSFSLASAPPMGSSAPTNKWVDMVYTGSGAVFLLVPNNGLWRSLDYGANWSKIWGTSTGSPTLPSINTSFAGYLAWDSANDYLYVATDTSVSKLSGFRAGSTVGDGTIIRTALTLPTAKPGSLRYGSIYGLLLVGRVTAQSDLPARLWYSKDSGTTWTEISDSTFHLTVQSTYEAQETLDGKIYVTTLGNGLLVGA